MAKGLVFGGKNGAQPFIKSIQRGYMTLNSTYKTFNIPITAVNKSNAIVNVYLGALSVTTSDDIRDLSVTAYLVSDDTIRVDRDGQLSLNSSIYRIYWEVIEFENVKSKQEGLYTSVSGTELNINVTGVDISKTLLFFNVRSGGTTSSSSGYSPLIHALQLTSPTTIMCRPGSGSKAIRWQLLEFN